MRTAQELEIHFGLPFKEQTDIPALRQFHAQQAFCSDADGEIIGLCICETPLKQIVIPESLSKLQYLNVSDNESLERLALEVALPDLEHLDASDSKLRSIHFPAGFRSLQWLDISRNQLQEISFEGPMPALQFLNLRENQLRAFSIRARELRYAYLDKNQLQVLAFPIAPTELEHLYLRENKLDSLPENFLDLTGLKVLYVHENPLKAIPSNLIAEGPDGNSFINIRNYLNTIQKPEETRENDEVKLVFLGNSTVGKSSLFRYMKEGKYDETLPSTHGIVNEIWQPPGKDFQVNVWDFGGQEYYHATHRLFLSDNAVSLILFDQETNRQKRIPTQVRLYKENELVTQPMKLQHFPYSYWLAGLQFFSQTQLPEATFLVQSKMDKPNVKAVPVLDQDRKKYQLLEERHFRISIDGASRGIPKFQREYEGFYETLLDVLEKTKSGYPINEDWLEIKETLRAEDRKMLTYGEYRDICERISPGVSDGKNQGGGSILDTLTRYLHEIGVILYFEQIPNLKNLVFVNPKWLTDLIYRVLDYSVVEKEGKFDRSHVDRVLNEAATGDLNTDQMLDLMKHFELIFQVQDSDSLFVAPQYLPEENPEKNSRSFQHLTSLCDRLAFTLKYPNFLPVSIMTRLICRYGNLSETGDVFWKNGIVFRSGEEYGKSKVNSLFWVQSDGKGLLRVKTLNSADFSEIKALFDNLLDISQRSSDIQVSVDEQHYVSANDLLQHPASNVQIQCTEGRWLDVNDFAPLLGHIDANRGSKMVETTTPPLTKAFISYAHKFDYRYFELFSKGIETYSRGKWDVFDDRKILMGEDWHDRLQKEVSECDFAILLLSQEFFNSDYIKQDEFEQFLRRKREDGFPFFSILVSRCQFDQWKEVGKTQFFNAQGQHYGVEKFNGKLVPFDRVVGIKKEKGELYDLPETRDYYADFVDEVERYFKEKNKE